MSAAATGTPEPELDLARYQAFMERVMRDMGGAIAAMACGLGDRLGLFADLAAHGPATSAALAARTATDERCVRGWLEALAAASYLEYDPVTGAFALPREHAEFVADERSTTFMGGGFQLLLAFGKAVDKVAASFRTGDGVRQDEYDDDLSRGMERMSSPSFEHALVRQWLPAAAEALALLRNGARVADVGCGGGRAAIALARAFPASTFVGYDVFAPPLARATAAAKQAGLSGRVRFERRDAGTGLPERYDVVTAFNVLHDVADPRAVLASIRAALTPRGRCLILESACSERLEHNLSPMGAILYGTSLFYSTPVSIANGGNGAGAMSLPENTLRNVCSDAGLTLRRLAIANPFHALYEAKP